jgi:hypothetical protein
VKTVVLNETGMLDEASLITGACLEVDGGRCI